eukprot:366556-Chlamydomonas_euryale.AAC.9
MRSAERQSPQEGSPPAGSASHTVKLNWHSTCLSRRGQKRLYPSVYVRATIPLLELQLRVLFQVWSVEEDCKP